MKTNFINKKICIRILTTSILRVGKKETIICKNNSYTFKYLIEIYFSNYQKIKCSIQVLASALEKHNYINLTFETNVVIEMKKNTIYKLLLVTN
jgi:hypothetical protein